MYIFVCRILHISSCTFVVYKYNDRNDEAINTKNHTKVVVVKKLEEQSLVCECNFARI